MPLSVKGLVIRESVTGESTKIITLLTGQGILRAFACGARKPGSPLAGPCALFSYSDFLLGESRSDAYNVKSAETLTLFRSVFENVEQLALCGYFAELSLASVPSDPQAEEFLRLVLNSMYLMTRNRYPLDQIKTVFEWKTLEYAGYLPGIVACRECGAYESADMCFEIERQTLCCRGHQNPGCTRIPLSPAALTALRHILLAEPGRIFSFSIPDGSLFELGEASERSVRWVFERNFPTLAFYRSLAAPASGGK